MGLLFGLAEALAIILDEVGLEETWARTEKLAHATRESMRAIGLELLAPDAPSPACTAVLVPDGVDGPEAAHLSARPAGLHRRRRSGPPQGQDLPARAPRLVRPLRHHRRHRGRRDGPRRGGLRPQGGRGHPHRDRAAARLAREGVLPWRRYWSPTRSRPRASRSSSNRRGSRGGRFTGALPGRSARGDRGRRRARDHPQRDQGDRRGDRGGEKLSR